MNEKLNVQFKIVDRRTKEKRDMKQGFKFIFLRMKNAGVKARSKIMAYEGFKDLFPGGNWLLEKECKKNILPIGIEVEFSMCLNEKLEHFIVTLTPEELSMDMFEWKTYANNISKEVRDKKEKESIEIEKKEDLILLEDLIGQYPEEALNFFAN